MDESPHDGGALTWMDWLTGATAAALTILSIWLMASAGIRSIAQWVM